MQDKTRSTVRTVVLTVVALGATVAAPHALDAQLGNRATERVVFLMPEPGGRGDSAFAAELTREVRRRMEGKFRTKLRVVGNETVCDVLEQSAYRCDAVLSAAESERLARTLQADAYITGMLRREEGTPIARLRLIDLRRSGLSGWVRVVGQPGATPKDFASTVVDSLDHQVRAAEWARECSEERDKGDYDDARKRALRVFEVYPNHPSAWMCVSVLFEARRAPADSIIWALEHALQGDPMLERALERVGRLYQEKGDSLAALEAFRRGLALNPNDRPRWRGVVAGYIQVAQYEKAAQLADEWLARHPDDLEVQQFKARACVDGALWSCALVALAAQYEVDSTKIGDTVFYAQIIGAAQEIPDTVAMLSWSTEAVRRVPTSISLWRVHASALQTAGLNDSVVAVYERLFRADPTDIRSPLAAARILVEGLTIDTAVPLDTLSLFKAERLLDQVVAMSRDTSVLMNASALYAQPGIGLARIQRRLPMAVRLLEKSNANNVLNLEGLQQQASFFLGFAMMFQIFEFDAQVTAQESCALVRQEAEMIAKGKRALQIGAPLSPETAQQLLQQYASFEQRVPQLREAFCRRR